MLPGSRTSDIKENKHIILLAIICSNCLRRIEPATADFGVIFLVLKMLSQSTSGPPQLRVLVAHRNKRGNKRQKDGTSQSCRFFDEKVNQA
jgi:hypothetical protein